jgi:hypothetical protein
VIGTSVVRRGPRGDDNDLRSKLHALSSQAPFGHNGRIVVDDDWQADTTAGVKALQAVWSETETREFKLGTVAFLPGPQLISRSTRRSGAA